MKRFYWKITSKQLEGIGVIEVILILVIIIGLVLIFRDQIEGIIKKAFDAIQQDVPKISNDMAVPTMKP
ncbi:MAG: putative Flagellin, Flp1-like, domain [Herbinix sp.]|jgi:imidazoleglycerol phosphate synthase glutamine amidotransferase subunit HisH|nr:putative Flagellin, Flp1-like, domain [Herbinix sp.]